MKNYTISVECPNCHTNICLKNNKLPRYKMCPNCKEKITFQDIRMDIRQVKGKWLWMIL